MSDSLGTISRRDALSAGVRGAGLLALGGALGLLLTQKAKGGTLWQIDPWKCNFCGKCATECVLNPSAAKCVQVYPICGYCKLCTGYFEAEPNQLNTAAENQLCPTGAIKRKWIEGQYYEYSIDNELCIGCAKCVKGCTLYGNGSFFLQIDQEKCAGCNDCSIARVCPPKAISRVPADRPYVLKEPGKIGKE